jgi:hypothetical protein
MTSRSIKWSEELKGKENYQAYRLIYDLTRKLTIEQRNELWSYWKKINKKENINEIEERKGQLDRLF